MANPVITELMRYKNLDKAKFLQSFFKTGKGGYAEGDIFIGITVPVQRNVAKKIVTIPLDELQESIQSEIHECRLTTLLILVYKYEKANATQRKEIFNFYIKNTKYINNWDLVDVTVRDIVGEYLMDKDRSLLYRYATSENVWKKRMAIVATYAFIRKHDFKDTYKISEILLHDTHDLIHKAVGWMLREAGNRDLKSEEEFLNKHYKSMPRTMLRYAIEKFSPEKKAYYMKKS